MNMLQSILLNLKSKQPKLVISLSATILIIGLLNFNCIIKRRERYYLIVTNYFFLVFFVLAYIHEMKYPLFRNILLVVLIIFYLFAGANHFINPSFYLPIIPPYFFNWANEVNILSGLAEILLALLLIPKSTRLKAGMGIIIMLLAFIPSHIYFIQKGEFMIGSVLFNPLKSSIRLFIGQPLLILWAYWASKSQLKIIGF